MADGIVRKQKNTVLTIMISTVFFDYCGVEVELPAYGGYKRPPVRWRTAAVRCQRPECKPYLI